MNEEIVGDSRATQFPHDSRLTCLAVEKDRCDRLVLRLPVQFQLNFTGICLSILPIDSLLDGTWTCTLTDKITSQTLAEGRRPLSTMNLSLLSTFSVVHFH